MIYVELKGIPAGWLYISPETIKLVHMFHNKRGPNDFFRSNLIIASFDTHWNNGQTTAVFDTF